MYAEQQQRSSSFDEECLFGFHNVIVIRRLFASSQQIQHLVEALQSKSNVRLTRMQIVMTSKKTGPLDVCLRHLTPQGQSSLGMLFI